MPEKLKDKLNIKKYLKDLKAEFQRNDDDYQKTMQKMAVDLLSFDAKKFWLASRMAKILTYKKEAIEYFELALKSKDLNEYIENVFCGILELLSCPGILKESNEEIKVEIRAFFEAFNYGVLLGNAQKEQEKK